MKRPEYVAVVTGIYAALLRERRLPTGEELRRLELAFSREGFTDGYWRGGPGPDMFGVRPENAPDPGDLFRAAKAAYDREDLPKVPVAMEARFAAGQPARLTVRDGQGRTACAEGPAPEPARSRPLEPEDVGARLSKTGGTVYRVEEISLALDEGLSLPASAINALRRDGLEALTALRTAPPRRREGPVPPMPENRYSPAAPALTVSLLRPSQLTERLAEEACIIYLPAERIEEFDLAPYLGKRAAFCLSLPRVCLDREEPALLRLAELALEKGCRALAVQNLGQLSLAERLGVPARGDFGLNVFNSRSLQELSQWGLESAAVSFELRWEQIRDLKKPLPCEAIVYGRLPLMLTENCLTANALGGCAARNLAGPCRRDHALTDRRGERFPVLPAFGCRSEVENSRVLYLAGKPELRRCGLTWVRLRFTTETARECRQILEQYLRGEDSPPEGFTRGLFYRGVE